MEQFAVISHEGVFLWEGEDRAEGHTHFIEAKEGGVGCLFVQLLANSDED